MCVCVCVCALLCTLLLVCAFLCMLNPLHCIYAFKYIIVLDVCTIIVNMVIVKYMYSVCVYYCVCVFLSYKELLVACLEHLDPVFTMKSDTYSYSTFILTLFLLCSTNYATLCSCMHLLACTRLVF